jgi:hypothetical protein
MNFNVEKLIGVQVIIRDEFESYPIVDENFNIQLQDYKEFNLPIRQPQPKTDEEVKTIVYNNDLHTMSLTTYQIFVRNFMSNYTPYNGMLLFHGLGTGKTCSAITIGEEYRNYLKISGKRQRIYVMSMTDAILKNFKYQLFNESHLQLVNNKWICNSCVGDKFLQEIDPYQLKLMEKKTLCDLIETLIQEYYVFIGCKAFANKYNNEIPKSQSIHYIQENFEGSLFIIDEAHNIKEDITEGSFSNCLFEILQHTTIKLLLMTATPIFNSCRDFIFLSKLLNQNDKRPYIDNANTIFDINDNFVEGGKEVLQQHLHGYISYVKGENPYSFPYRIYPNLKYTHPENRDCTIEHLKIYPVKLSEFQSEKYIQSSVPNAGIELSVMTLYNQLAFITYKNGIKFAEAMKVIEGKLPDISYLPEDEHFFDPNHLFKYSAKLHKLQTILPKSEGIILIYVRQIAEGIYPISVALEAIGYKYRDGTKRINLCKHYNSKDNNHSYVILNPSFSHVNIQDSISAINDVNNKNGEHIKVVIITEALTEGVDFKNIRQIHILNPWWNLSQLEQIIGRAVRYRSHKDLNFEHRNVELFLYTAFLHDNSAPTIDYRMYCNSEQKAKKIGEVTRLLKEIAFDCKFNVVQTQSNESLDGLTVKQLTSSGMIKNHPIGDMPYTVLSDYKEECNYSCTSSFYESKNKLSIPYLTSHVKDTIQQIKILFSKNYVYTRDELIQEVPYIPEEKLDYTLSQIIHNKIPILDRFNQQGYLINIGEYYMFQPPELSVLIPTYERRIPMAYIHDTILVKPMKKQVAKINVIQLIERLKKSFDLSNTEITKQLRAVENDLLMYSVFEQLHSKLITTELDMKNWEKDKKILMIDFLMDRLTDIECLELAIYLHNQKPLNEFEQMLKEYYKKIKVNGIYILWSYTDNKINYYTDDWSEYVHYKYPSLQIYKLDSDKNIDSKELPLGGISANKDLSEREFKLSLATLPNEKPRYGFKITRKPDAIEILQRLIPTISITENKYKIEHYILQIECCLRFFDLKQYKNKRWFLNPVEVIQNVARNFNLINESLKEKSKK